MVNGTVNRNASASAFGWEFQTNAAIVLFIRNIEEARSLRVEGAHEDIEITLCDGSTIYAQAKARSGNEPGKNAIARLEGALKTLAEDAKLNNYRSLVFVTNDDYPFGKSRDVTDLHGGGTLEFKELPNEIQFFIKDKGSVYGFNDEAFESMEVSVIGFYGNDEDTRHKYIRAEIRDFLEKLNLSQHREISDKTLRDQWGTLLSENASSTDTDISLSKEDFVWPIIVMLCGTNVDDRCFEEFEEETVQDVVAEYGSIIDYHTQRFEFVSRVSFDFDQYRSQRGGNRKTLRKQFAGAHWSDYVEELGLSMVSDTETREIVAQLIILKVLRRKEVIKGIKDGVNLDN